MGAGMFPYLTMAWPKKKPAEKRAENPKGSRVSGAVQVAVLRRAMVKMGSGAPVKAHLSAVAHIGCVYCR